MKSFLTRLPRTFFNRWIYVCDGIKWTYSKIAMHAPNVMTIDDTIDKIMNHCSISRNGDGELNIMMGRDIPFQIYDFRLAKIMREAIAYQADDYLSCLPDIFVSYDNLHERAQNYYHRHLHKNRYDWIRVSKLDIYGNAFVSRPYMDLKDKTPTEAQFQRLKQIWNNRDIVIVEGEKSRLGVGNDLFDNVRSIQRIIGPARDAFSRYDEIKDYVIQTVTKDKLILLALGPTATAMAYELFLAGHWAVDIGHVDIEYEWMRMGATEKVAIKNKYTNEAIDRDGTIVQESIDTKYKKEISKTFI